MLRAQRGDAVAPFQVVEVTRAQVAALARWPVTGWSGGYRWPQAARAPDSAVIRSGDRLDFSIWDTQENSLLATSDTRVQTILGLFGTLVGIGATANNLSD